MDLDPRSFAKAPAGNTTIVVRGAHDGFPGEYDETNLIMKTGADDAHRFMVVGYGQERPVIKGCHQPDPALPLSTFKWPYNIPTQYTTLQRVKVQDNYGNGVRSCENDSFINVIDVWLMNNCKYDPAIQDQYADGNLYFLGSDRCHVLHCTSECTAGHAFKIGDGAPTTRWWSGACRRSLDTGRGAHEILLGPSERFRLPQRHSPIRLPRH